MLRRSVEEWPQCKRTVSMQVLLKCGVASVAGCTLLLLLLHLQLAMSGQPTCDSPDSNCQPPSNNKNSRAESVKSSGQWHTPDKQGTVHLSVVACGERLEETLIMIKSAAILTTVHILVHIFADDDLRPLFQKQLDTWPSEIREHLSYKLYPISFPDSGGHSAAEWKKLFKLCASQRLFFPDLLADIDAVLYVDTDILFMRPIEDVWQHFSHFNSSHIAALSPEHESPSAGWYNRFARHPFYGPLGVNSGVMLMNLTRMRQAQWLEHIGPYYKEYKLRITWGDQDLINIFFHYFPDKLYIYDCDWNYRPDHCMYMSNCKQAENRGISVVHGCRSVYHNDKQPVFKAVYHAFRDYKFGEGLQSDLLAAMKTNMKSHSTMPCGRVSHVFTKLLEKTIDSMTNS